MIERITEMPAGTVGFRVAGEVERDDYTDVLVPDCAGRSTPAVACGPCI
jgi:hypothetical protein